MTDEEPNPTKPQSLEHRQLKKKKNMNFNLFT